MDKRGELLVLVFCFVFVFIIGFVSAADITSCRDLTADSEHYVLTQDVGATGSCMNITADNIVLDCNNYLINYSNFTEGYGINNSGGWDNISIINCLINQTNITIQGFHIFMNNSDNSSVEYCNMTNGKAGILVVNSHNVTVSHNYGYKFDYGAATEWATCDPFNTTSSYKFYESGIWLVGSNNGTIFNNTIYGDVTENGASNHGGTEAGVTLCKCNYTNITQNKIYYADTFGFIFSQSHYNDFFYNIINGSNTSGAVNTNDGIIMGGASGDVDAGACNNNNLSHNEFYDCCEWGLFLSQADNNTLYNNTANSNVVGIRIGGTSSSNKLYENTVNSNTDYGIGIEGNYNEVINLTSTSNTERGIYITDYLSGYCLGNIIINAEIDSAKYGVYFGVDHLGGCQNTTIKDSIITNSGTNDIYAIEGLEGIQILNATFLNVSFDKTKISFSPDIDYGALYFKWYVDVATNYTNNSAGNGATVNFYNKSKALKYTDTVESTSLITRQNVTEFYETSAGKTYMNNYDMNATIADYISETESVNVTTNMIDSNKVQLTLRNCGCGSSTFNYTCGETVTESCTLNCNVNATGTCFDIGAHNLILDGGNNMIMYSLENWGFGINNTDGYDNITIRNFWINQTNVSHQGFHIFLNNSDNSTVEYNNMTNGKAGVLVINSHNVTISHNYGARFDYGAATLWTTCHPFNSTDPYKYYESGIWLVESNNGTIFNNTIYGDITESGFSNHEGMESAITLCKCNTTNITQNTVYYADTFGFNLAQSYYNTINYNFVNGSNFTGVANTNDGIILGGASGNVDVGACNYNNLSHNEVYSSYEWGLFLSNSNETWIINNTCKKNNVGIRVGGTSSHNKLHNNSLINNIGGTLGDGLLVEGQNNEVNNNEINNNERRGIYVDTSGAFTASNNTFKNNNLLNNGYGIRVDGAVDNEFINLNISGSTTKDIYSIDATSNNTFLNVSFDKSKTEIVEGTIYVKWYMDVFVNYSNGSIAPGATVNAYDNASSLRFTDTSESDGYITRQNVTEYYENSTQKYYLTNYSMNATINPYSPTKQVNFTNNLLKEDDNETVLTIDNTDPVPTLTINPASIVLEGSTTITCSGTDSGGTGLSSVIVSSSENSSICSNSSCSGNSCSCQADSYTPTYVGIHTITCLVTDNSANTDTAAGNLEVTAGGGGGGGGGGGVEPPVQPPEEPYCGDGTCDSGEGETCENCPEDCGYVLCSIFVSGTAFCCSGLEQNTIYDMACYTSTGSCSGCEMIGSNVCTKCGNGLCESCENYCNCPEDCAVCENIWLEVEMVFGIDEGIYIPIITPIIQPIINPIQRGLGM